MNNIILEAAHISKSFSTPAGKIDVLKDVSLQIHQGESVSIQGESGAGKSTLLNLLTLLERPDSGEISWENQIVHNKRNSFLAKKRAHLMGLIFQSYYLIPELNVIENVLFARRLIGSLQKNDIERAEKLIDSVNLSHRIKHLSTELSGGEMQRVAIARALMNRPTLVIADEPTGNLDEKTASSVMQMFLNLCRNERVALALVTHNPEFAAQADRKVRLHQGCIIND